MSKSLKYNLRDIHNAIYNRLHLKQYKYTENGEEFFSAKLEVDIETLTYNIHQTCVEDKPGSLLVFPMGELIKAARVGKPNAMRYLKCRILDAIQTNNRVEDGFDYMCVRNDKLCEIYGGEPYSTRIIASTSDPSHVILFPRAKWCAYVNVYEAPLNLKQQQVMTKEEAERKLLK